MEGLLQCTRLAEIAFDLTSPLVFFPVRHHSPACAHHISLILKQYQPEVVLIEGPANANQLIPVLTDQQSQAPLCIYYTYTDTKGLIGEPGERFRCYYPFLDYSPELVALREAAAAKIPASFIDLTYPEILVNSFRGSQQDTEAMNVYNDDYLLDRSRYIQELCQRQGCRNLNELWEKLYELDGIRLSTAHFVANMLAFCYFARVDYTPEMLKLDGCLAREQYMAARIREAREKYQRVLVVTGGFHTWGLLQELGLDTGSTFTGLAGSAESTAAGSRGSVESASAGTPRAVETASSDSAGSAETTTSCDAGSALVPLPPGESGVYAMAYSFAETDQLNGYASGMPFPAFYQRAWEQLRMGSTKPYERTVLSFTVAAGRSLRKQAGENSTADQIEAFNLAKGLAALREKNECGVYECIEGVKTSFAKGELDLGQQSAQQVLLRLLRGRKLGKLCPQADLPPIVHDYRHQIKRLKLKANSSVQQEVVLDIYKNKRHREISCFLHIMVYLKTGFAEKVKGPDLVNRRNTSLIREIWRYRWSREVESALIQLAVYGGTLREAVQNRISDAFGKLRSQAGEASLLLVEACLMGIDSSIETILGEFETIIQEDGSCFSVCTCAYNLGFLLNTANLLAVQKTLATTSLLQTAFRKAVFLLPQFRAIDSQSEDKAVRALKDLFLLSQTTLAGEGAELLAAALCVLKDSKLKADAPGDRYIGGLAPGDRYIGEAGPGRRYMGGEALGNDCIAGAATGILVGLNCLDRAAVLRQTQGYFAGTGTMYLRAAAYLKGLFATCRDVVFWDPEFLAGLNQVVIRLGEDEFLQVLPLLRQCFTYFTPREIRELGSKIALLYETGTKQVLDRPAVNSTIRKQAVALDHSVGAVLERWGIG